MVNKLRIYLFNHRTWVYNLQYILLSVVLLAVVTVIDHFPDFWQGVIPSFFYTRLELARSVLGSLSSGLLAISIFTFSSILAVLIFYSGSFSPRVVENFVGKKITMKVLGIFIGGFTYCVASLNFMRGEDPGRLVIAGTVAIIYVLVCIIYLVIFIQTTIRSVQINNVVLDIYEETLPVILKDVEDRNHQRAGKAFDEALSIPIMSDSIGYFELFNSSGASAILEEYDASLKILVKAGEFVVEGQEIGSISIGKEKDVSTLSEKLVSFYEIHENKISITDYVYGLDKITDIALMALSPGVNDPSTAKHCIRKLSSLLSYLATTDAYHHVEVLENDRCIYSVSNKFSEDLFRVVSPIVEYGREDVHVLTTLFEGMRIMLSRATDDNAEHIYTLASEIYSIGENAFNLKSDRDYFQSMYKKYIHFN